jgi:hypothetical protein
LWSVIFFILNIFAVIIAYFIILNKIEKKIINKKILDKIKEEVNSIIVQLNEATLNNINLLEDKIKNLNKRIHLASRKIGGLKTESEKSDKFTDILSDDELGIKENSGSMLTYSPKKIVNQSMKITEELINTKMKAGKTEFSEENDINNEIKNLSRAEKAVYLHKKGWNIKEIQKKAGLSSGEIEFLINMENIHR